MALPWSHPFVYAWALGTVALVLDWFLGDPVYRWHPVRLMGAALIQLESYLRRKGWNGRGGGILLFLGLAGIVLGMYFGIRWTLQVIPQPHWAGLPLWPTLWDLFLAYSLLAFGDLVRHVRRVDQAASRGDAHEARKAISMLVGRDTQHLDFQACRRAAVESLAENLTDGVIAPLFWLWLMGIPGLLIFKIASTMDSMVGYKNERYLYFGWFGARLDDVLCWIPARITFLFLSLGAAFIPGLSGRKAWRMGRSQHQVLPGPNPGWSEATAAGALQIRLIGPIDKDGKRITEVWIGEAGDPEGGRPQDIARMQTLSLVATSLFWSALALVGFALLRASQSL
jgi:adenosylcobinamide-phosphate synthase